MPGASWRALHTYNNVRLHSGIGYVTPQARLEGRDQQILASALQKSHGEPFRAATGLMVGFLRRGSHLGRALASYYGGHVDQDHQVD